MTPIAAELVLERGRDRHRVEDRVDRDAGEPLLLAQRDAELVEHLPHLGVDLVRLVGAGPFGFGAE